MSQQGTDHHIWKKLGEELHGKRRLEDDPEAMSIVRAVLARGHTAEAILRVMREMDRKGRG
jgi:hypothetical protein